MEWAQCVRGGGAWSLGADGAFPVGFRRRSAGLEAGGQSPGPAHSGWVGTSRGAWPWLPAYQIPGDALWSLMGWACAHTWLAAVKTAPGPGACVVFMGGGSPNSVWPEMHVFLGLLLGGRDWAQEAAGKELPALRNQSLGPVSTAGKVLSSLPTTCVTSGR